ncbi:MAG: adenosylcobinamide-GDP ribazoletransferase [Alphaproteobacteria bacterium]|jgi:adenosylcobinamide-GDP ribazoletransferase|nr:adenosylcobinamide-GDP ribazoletransferase [Alphaproteobacteria bacterium]
MTDQPDLTPSDSPTGEPQASSGPGLKSPPAITVKAPSAEAMWKEIAIAVNYLTRINIKIGADPIPRFVRKSMMWFPLVGAGIGAFGACVDWVMTQIGLPGIVTSAFAVISMLWITRALHEEEFATMANQYGLAFDKDKEQGISWLKEERSVQYGTLAVILIIIMKIGAIASLSDNNVVFQALIASACWSRAMMVVMASWLRPLAGDPVADYFQQPPAMRMLLAVGIGLLIVYFALGSYAPYVIVLGGGAGLLVTLLGANHLRGYNGALMGSMQEIVEITILGVILAVQ